MKKLTMIIAIALVSCQSETEKEYVKAKAEFSKITDKSLSGEIDAVTYEREMNAIIVKMDSLEEEIRVQNQ